MVTLRLKSRFTILCRRRVSPHSWLHGVWHEHIAGCRRAQRIGLRHHHNIRNIGRRSGFQLDHVVGCARANRCTIRAMWRRPDQHERVRLQGDGVASASPVDVAYGVWGPLTTNLTVESWDTSLAASSESIVMHEPTGTPIGITGCEHLSFPPALTVAPDTSYADTPAGLTVDVKVPEEGLT